MKIKAWLLSLTILLAVQSIEATIEKVTIKWTAALCMQSCGQGLEAQLRKIAGVSNVTINLAAGQADLQWKPNVPFTFGPINVAMSLMGLSINDIRVKVSGTITHDDKNVWLNSTGDNTQFQLLNRTIPVKNQYVEQFSPYNRELTPELRAELLDGESKKEIATIEGPFFEPERSPPLMLIVERVHFPQK